MKRIIACIAALVPGVMLYAQKPVDVHAHIILPEYKEMLRRHGAELEETFPLPGWDTERHAAFMDSAGIGCAVLTMPAPQPYYGNVEESAACIRWINEVSAKVKAGHPGRFRFSGWKRGMAERKSVWSNVVLRSKRPVSIAFPNGLNGTKPMPSSSRSSIRTVLRLVMRVSCEPRRLLCTNIRQKPHGL